MEQRFFTPIQNGYLSGALVIRSSLPEDENERDAFVAAHHEFGSKDEHEEMFATMAEKGVVFPADGGDPVPHTRETALKMQGATDKAAKAQVKAEAEELRTAQKEANAALREKLKEEA